MHTLDIVLIIITVSFAAMGLMAIFAPLRVTEQFGISSLTVDGRNEVRAVYGGFGLTVAVALGLAFTLDEVRAGICIAIALALAGMAIGRLISAALDLHIGYWPIRYLFIEVFAAVGLFYAGGII